MFVRKLEEVEKTDRFVEWGAGTSHRLITRDDEMGFTVCHTVVSPRTESLLQYRNHLEACYCVSGEGEIEDEHGVVHAISPYKLLRASQIARSAACFLGIAGYMMIDGVGWLIALSAITGVLTTQGLMSREVILTQAFKTQRFEKVLSYTQIADQLGMVLGPLVAAFLLTVWDWQIIVIGVAVLFIAADLCMSVWWRVTRPEMTPPAKLETNWFSPLVEAGRHIWHLPALKAVILLAAAVNLIIGVTLATAPAMVTGLQGQTEFYYGVLQAAGAIATVVILFAIAHVVLPLNFPWFLGIFGDLHRWLSDQSGADSGRLRNWFCCRYWFRQDVQHLPAQYA